MATISAIPDQHIASISTENQRTRDDDARSIVMRQRHYFEQQHTLSYEARIKALTSLQSAIRSNEQRIYAALQSDLGKPATESYLTEYVFVLEEIKYTLRHLRSWMQRQRANATLMSLPGRAYIDAMPFGVTLVIAPWNYPFQLAIAPVIASISAGNTVIVKPSEHAPATSALIAEMIAEAFAPELIAVVQGDHVVSQALLKQKFDYVFFTGGTEVGTKVAVACAEQLTPYTLELGGKSPCIVDADIDLKITAKRIVWGKFINAGQTCIAPDYVLVHQDQYEHLLSAMKHTVREFYGDNPAQSPDYARIIHERHFDRLAHFISEGNVTVGGGSNRTEKYIAPTILTDIQPNARVMKEEIFGPILPVIPYATTDDAIRFVQSFSRPLALYIFSNQSSVQDKVLKNITFGGGCINDTLFHISVPSLPFGGVGQSGSGAYHGKHGFDTFSHKRSIVKKYFWADIALRYAPYKQAMRFFKKLLGD